jgi:hypothetical protein
MIPMPQYQCYLQQSQQQEQGRFVLSLVFIGTMSPPTYPVSQNWGYGIDYIGDLEQTQKAEPNAASKDEDGNKNE